MIRYYLTLASLIISSAAFATEETLDLNQVSPAVPPPALTVQPVKFNLMGRVDLTSEYTSTGSNNKEDENNFKNNHFFIFLKVKASEKTTFIGELVEQKFFQVDYTHSARLTWQFGNIVVPFGDIRRFHHYYGGVQGYGTSGVMLANLWASPGTNLQWNFSKVTLDTYLVNAISYETAGGQDVDLQSTRTDRQAVGARGTFTGLDKITFFLSGYFADYAGERSITMAGTDVYTEYGLVRDGFFKDVRLALGMANAWVESLRPDFQRRGDYLEISTRAVSPVELRLRYGTYIHDTRAESQNDVRSLNFGGSFSVDVLRILLEYQMNYEARNEIDNDMARAMVSLDF